MRAYDPAFAYEMAVIILDGMQADVRRRRNGDLLHHAAQRKLRACRRCPPACEEGIIRGMYKLSTRRRRQGQHRGPAVRQRRDSAQALQAQKILAEKYNIASDVWSVTSYTELRRDAQACERWNMLHPDAAAAAVATSSRRWTAIEGPFVAASDYVRALAEQISRWVPGGLYALGTDGFGRSESRERLRRHFEVDAECIALATLYQLKKQGKCDGQCVANAVKDLGIDPEKQSALYA